MSTSRFSEHTFWKLPGTGHKMTIKVVTLSKVFEHRVAREESSTPDLFMAPKSPKRAALAVSAKRAETPRSERARRRQDERDADEDDDADETEEEEESEDLHLQGVDGLSTAELRKLKDGMDILNKLTPDAISALASRPLQTVAQVEEMDHGE